MLTVIIFAGLLALGLCDEQDRVLSLPGLPSQLPFKVYSGFLNANEGSYLHYVFLESQRNPAEDPVLLWLNGGPGCSSLMGLFTEQGPYRIKRDEFGLEENEYAWNKISNMIFLESPAGVGFSYSDSESYQTGDEETAINNVRAIKSFFKKFPKFKANDFYISGESYAGIYIPTLSVKLLNEPSIRYKGFVIGNGILDTQLRLKSRAFFANYHGYIEPDYWQEMLARCCNGISEESCVVSNPKDPHCSRSLIDIINDVDKSGINMYNVNQDCEGDPSESKSKLKHRGTRWNIEHKMLAKSLEDFALKIAGIGLEQNSTLGGEHPCVDDSHVVDYLNQDDVRLALNIPDSLPPWSGCSDEVFDGYRRTVQSVRPHIVRSLLAGKQGLIYNGDADFMCDFLSAEWFTKDLGFPAILEKQPWHANGQTAGFVKHYTGFAVVTVKGAGHMVPTDRPAAALEMIETFLEGRMFT